MKPQEIAVFLQGKTVQEISHHAYMGWNMCIDEILFTDGTILSLCGNADEAYIDGLEDSKGNLIIIEEEEK